MKYLKYILILAVVPFSYGQQEKLFSQYMFNPSMFNAGYTGSRKYFRQLFRQLKIKKPINTGLKGYMAEKEGK